MATWSTTKAPNVTCPHCGSEYEVTIRRFPVRDEDSFDCEVCGEEMNSWNDTACPTYRLIKRGKAPAVKGTKPPTP